VNRELAFILSAANTVGAIVVFLFLTFLLQVRHPPPVGDVLVWNLPPFVLLGILASVLGPRWGRRMAEPRLRWLREERAPSSQEQRRVLRTPIVPVKMTCVFWSAAAAFFGLINLRFSGDAAARTAEGIVMGGLVTGAIAYLLSERTLRPVTARALAAGVPMRPVAPGVVVRTVLAWALATGVPLVGIIEICSGVLGGDTPRSVTTVWAIVAVAAIGIAAGALTIFFAAKSIAEPIRSVRRALARVEEGVIDVEVPVDDASEVGLLQAGFNRMAAGLRERERLRDLFGRHVGEDVARQALEAGVELGGEVREAAALFVDVIGSTALAADEPPHEVVRRLNRFFAIVLDVVQGHGGWVNKFEGDAALCVFGVPTPLDDPARCALASARELAVRLEADSPLEAAIGVSAGEVVAGNVGAAERFEYTVIGDPVNEAARLTEIAKEQRPHVLASGRAIGRAAQEEAARWQLGGDVVLRGRSEATTLATPVESVVRAT